MQGETPKYVLFSSDSNPQYEKDIYNVIALPYNGEYRFRYKAQYIDNQSRNDFQQEKHGDRVLIAFRTNSADENKSIEPFVVPIRWAVLDKVECIDTIYIIHFTAKDYPVFSSRFKTACHSYEENVAFSRELFNTKDKNKLFVSSTPPDLALPEESKDINSSGQEQAWISIIEALSKHKIFKEQFFFKTVISIDSETKALEMRENRRGMIEIVHYNSDDKSANSASVEIQYDSDVLTSVLGDHERIECRYDKNSFPFIPKYINQRIDTQITFNFSTDHSNKETKIRVPVRIKRSNCKRLIRAGISFLGAALVGISSVIENMQPGLKIAAFIVGSFLVAASWMFSKGD